MQKIQSELAALCARRELLTGKRSAAQSTLDSAVEARQKMLLTGDIEDHQAALALQARIDSATSALVGFDTAITAQGPLIIGAEAKLAAERLDTDRKAASDTLAVQVTVVDQLLGPWVRASRDLATALDAIHWHFESTQMAAFIRNATGEVESAAAMTADDLKHSIQLMRDGVLAIPSVPNVAAVVVQALPIAVVPYAPPVKTEFHRVDRGPSYQMKFAESR
jgi:hypothetical protein